MLGPSNFWYLLVNALALGLLYNTHLLQRVMGWHRLLRNPMEIGLAELIAQQSRDGDFRGSNTFQTYLMDSYTLQFWQDKGLTFSLHKPHAKWAR